MQYTNYQTVPDLERYIKEIFDMKDQIYSKSMKIITLELEVEIQKKMLDILYGHKLEKFKAGGH